jgi:putative restriction endonuclease
VLRAFIGITDGDWFELLSSLQSLEEINFWQPSGNARFRALEQGELFLFKLHSPRNFIVGGGFFGYSTLLPVSLAWDTFRQANGANSLREMRQRIEFYRRRQGDRFDDYTIGCIILEQPFFLSQADWIPAPEDWHPNIVRGATLTDSTPSGKQLLARVQVALTRTQVRSLEQVSSIPPSSELTPRYGSEILVRPRLGQGAFRFLVTDAYERRCAITRERTLPVLQAAHIRPYSEGGDHRVDNGLLLRSDLHTLFDQGYLTVTPDYRIEVSRRIREEFENGRDYYALNGRELNLPRKRSNQPSPQYLAWHNESVFRL